MKNLADSLQLGVRNQNVLILYGCLNVHVEEKTQCLIAWTEELKVSYPCVYRRLKRGWSFEKAVTIPKL